MPSPQSRSIRSPPRRTRVPARPRRGRRHGAGRPGRRGRDPPRKCRVGPLCSPCTSRYVWAVARPRPACTCRALATLLRAFLLLSAVILAAGAVARNRPDRRPARPGRRRRGEQPRPVHGCRRRPAPRRRRRDRRRRAGCRSDCRRPRAPAQHRHVKVWDADGTLAWTRLARAHREHVPARRRPGEGDRDGRARRAPRGSPRGGGHGRGARDTKLRGLRADPLRRRGRGAYEIYADAAPLEARSTGAPRSGSRRPRSSHSSGSRSFSSSATRRRR